MSDIYPVEVMGVQWHSFGLKRNPYSNRALQEGGDAPIEDLFVGRDKERAFLDRMFASDQGGCLTICGNVGVGKTSLANYQKHVWKYKKVDLLFSARRELEANDRTLNKQQFILGIITSVIREIELLDPQLLKDPEFARLKNLGDIVSLASGGFNIGGGVPAFSASFGLEKSTTNIQPLQLTDAALEGHLDSLVKAVISRNIATRSYRGLIVHMNNFDIVLKDHDGIEKVVRFFDEIRDLLQHPRIFFVFLGPQGFFKDVICKEQRVKGIFSHTPIVLEPLSKTELAEALRARINAFKSDDVSAPIQPVHDDVIYRFYDLYEGDVRLVLNALSDVLKRSDGSFTGPLGVHEAMTLLATDRRESIADIITPEKQKILDLFLSNDKPLTQTEIAGKLGKQSSNISFFLKPFRERGVIVEVEREGKNIYLDLSTSYACLRHFADSKKHVEKSVETAKRQLDLGI